MRFFRDDGRKTKVIWYFVPDDRETVPYAHSFASRIYERADELQEEIGELYSPVPWRGGQPPCPETFSGLCGTEQQWQRGALLAESVINLWPGTNVPKCCQEPFRNACGGIAYGDTEEICHVDSTFDLYRPFGAGVPTFTNVPCSFVNDLRPGRGTSPNNTVAWTHYIDIATSVDVLDGCTRTAMVNTLNYFDGDEVRIPTGGSARYVVVWVTLCDSDSGVVKRVYLMRNNA